MNINVPNDEDMMLKEFGPNWKIPPAGRTNLNCTPMEEHDVVQWIDDFKSWSENVNDPNPGGSHSMDIVESPGKMAACTVLCFLLIGVCLKWVIKKVKHSEHVHND